MSAPMPAPSRLPDHKLTGLTGTLRCCQIFSSLSGEDLQLIASFASPITLAKGDGRFRIPRSGE